VGLSGAILGLVSATSLQLRIVEPAKTQIRNEMILHEKTMALGQEESSSIEPRESHSSEGIFRCPLIEKADLVAMLFKEL